jgi:hypothetical protein
LWLPYLSDEYWRGTAYSLRGRAARNPLATTAHNFLLGVPLALVLSAIHPGGASATVAGIALAVASGALAVASGALASGGGYTV